MGLKWILEGLHMLCLALSSRNHLVTQIAVNQVRFKKIINSIYKIIDSINAGLWSKGELILV